MYFTDHDGGQSCITCCLYQEHCKLSSVCPQADAHNDKQEGSRASLDTLRC